MSIAYHKKTGRKFVQYTVRFEEELLEKLKSISANENLSLNEVINQSVQFAIEDYEKHNK